MAFGHIPECGPAHRFFARPTSYLSDSIRGSILIRYYYSTDKRVRSRSNSKLVMTAMAPTSGNLEFCCSLLPLFRFLLCSSFFLSFQVQVAGGGEEVRCVQETREVAARLAGRARGWAITRIYVYIYIYTRFVRRVECVRKRSL